MIEVEVNSIRVSLMNQQRIVVLKDINDDRYLPIWIGQFEAEAIMVWLQEREQVRRPLTHDLLKSAIEEMGGQVRHILVNDIRGDIYYAKIVIEQDGRELEIDSRPSDAIALAVRVKCPIFISEYVMDKSAKRPEEDVELEASRDSEEPSDVTPAPRPTSGPDVEPIDESKFSAFADFVNSLDLDELDDDDQ